MDFRFRGTEIMYAQSTSVSVEKSEAEIKHMIIRYGADQYFSGWQDGAAVIGFRYENRCIRIELPLPNQNDPEFEKTPAGRKRRNKDGAYKAWEQSCRAKWRLLCLMIKAKLEAIDQEVVSFEDEFLPYTVLPDGKTMAQWARPQIGKMLESGKMPQKLLPG